MDDSTDYTVCTRRSLSERFLNNSSTLKSNIVSAIGDSRKRSQTEESDEQQNEIYDNYSKRSNRLELKDMYKPDTAADIVHSSSMLPLRRSKREKRLIYANFTPSEIEKTIHNQHTINLMDDNSEEEELDPYEKLLSPIAQKKKKFVEGSHSYLTRSSKLTEVVRQANNNEQHTQSDNDSSQLENGTEEDDEGEETSYYNLRKRRPVVYQYQPVIQVVDKDTRKKTVKRHKSYTYQSAAYQPRKGHRLTNNFCHKAHQDSTTSSSEDSDEERFKRRKKRSMKRSRLDCLPMNFTPEDMRVGPMRDRAHIGTSLADISPMNVDRSITFDSIGGLKQHIRSLKEMIVFPLMYPEVFEKFNISPPRGVLFHGPPGCGKTLVARALANECSRENRKIAFFMRKGADCLSKWVGESERQLRLLFDQAYQMRPSILFFDEIDGLAPVRSTRQDQIHSSIVSTLLALMDGLDSRGEVVVIGATNRIDSIDPALRRPGRFDREFIFPLPTRQDRSTILQIHTKCWNPPLPDKCLDELSELTVGYCGADIKALCTEAAMHSLRRQYPQIYESSDKLVIDVSKLVVSSSDFYLAYKDIVPTQQRSNMSVSKPLSDVVFPLIGIQFENLLKQLVFVFPESWKSVCKGFSDIKKRIELENERRNEIDALMRPNNTTPPVTPRHSLICTNSASPLFSKNIEGVFFDLKDSLNSIEQKSYNTVNISTHPHILPKVHRPRLLLAGSTGMGQSDHLSLALLHTCEDIPLKVLDTPTILGSVSQTPEEVCIKVFKEASRVVPCIVYIPRIDALWEVMSDSFKATFKSILDSLPCNIPLLLLATVECVPDDLSDDLTQIFPVSVDNCFKVIPLEQTDRESFFFDALLKQPLMDPPRKPTSASAACKEPLPLAAPPKPRELTEVEMNRAKKHHESVLRELRVFLRENTNRLLAERKFKDFTKPVNTEEVPDYLDIIAQPMDLSTIMKKIDDREYNVPKEWLTDIDTITSNAFEYNPKNDTDSRLLRHRALALQDLSHSIFDHELDEEFEKQCEDMNDTFKRIQGTYSSPLKNAVIEDTDQSVIMLSDERPTDIRRSLRKKGLRPHLEGLPYYAPPKPRTPKKDEGSKQEETTLDIMTTDSRDSATTRRLSFEDTFCDRFLSLTIPSIKTPSPPLKEQHLIIDKNKLVSLFDRLVRITADCSVETCLKIHSTIGHLIFRHRMDWNKQELLKELELSINIAEKELTSVD